MSTHKFNARHETRDGDNVIVVTGLATPLIIAVHPDMPLDARNVIANNLNNIFHILETNHAPTHS